MNTAQPLPWRLTDLRRFVATLGGALGAVVLGAHFTAQNARVSDQIGWLIVALLGVIAAAVRCATFLAVAYSAISVRRAELLTALRPTDAEPEPSAAATAAQSTWLVALPVMAYFHRSDCPFVRGKAAPSATRAQHLADGRRPCPGCAP